MATVTNSEAANLVRLVLSKLDELRATDLIAGIDESQRLGLEEPIKEEPGETRGLNQLGLVRRRPPTDIEMLRIVFERLRQRLLVVPAIAQALQRDLKLTKIEWRVDREFVSPERSPALEARLTDLFPDGASEVVRAYNRIHEMIPEHVPAERNHG